MIAGYLTHLLIIIGIFMILSLSLNLAVGYTGLLNLGHIALFGIGAYTSTLLVIAGWPFILAFIAAGLISAIAGVILMFAVKRLSGDYLALATLGFSFVTYSLMLNLTKLTRGPIGIPGIPKPNLFGWQVTTNIEYFIFTLITTLIVIGILHRITSSKYGKLLEAVRDDEVGLSVLGKHVFKLKVQSLAVSAFFAGIAGSLFAHYITFIDPSSFYLSDLILILTIIMVGGLASLRGTVIATVLILLIPEALRFVSLPSSIIGPARQIIFALILIAILLYNPKGLFGRVQLK